MTTWFVSRHPGALEWVREQGIHVDQVATHLDPAILQPGDRVIGTLPVHLAAQVHARGAHFDFLALDLPANWRGRELNAEELRACGARLERYAISQVPTPSEGSK